MIAPAAAPVLLRLSDAAAALALLAVNARLRAGWAMGWLIWAGLIGYLIYAYGLYTFDRVMNPAWLLYLAVLSLSVFAALWLSMLAPAMAARMPLPGQTIFVPDLAFALPLTGLSAVLLWRGHPGGDLLAIPMLMKVAVLGVSVFLGTFYTWALFDGPFMAFDLALYALMGFGPAALIWPVWRGLEVAKAP